MAKAREVRTRGERIVDQIASELREYFTEDETIEIYDGSSLEYEVKTTGKTSLFHLQVKDPELKTRHRHITIEVRGSF